MSRRSDKASPIALSLSFPQQLDVLWRDWLTEKPQALDRWLGKKRPAGMEIKRWLSLNEALFIAVRFQELAVFLEAAIQQPSLKAYDFDSKWQSGSSPKMASEFFWHWLELRAGQNWGFAKQVKNYEKRLAFFEKQAELAKTSPFSALGLIWQGLRPNLLPKLQERAALNGWSEAQLLQFIDMQNAQPPLWLRANELNHELSSEYLKLLQQQLLEAGVNCQLRQDQLCAMGGKGVEGASIYQEGKIEIQDLASQQVAYALDVQPGDKVWDACAGAGGKSLALAAKLKNKGALVATDLHEFKLNVLKKRASRAGVRNIRTFVWAGNEALRLPQEIARQGGFDKILIDAPCSASGTWRRNADARHNQQPDKLQELLALQQQLLTQASLALRAGGTLAYATCSWFKEENEDQVAAFITHSGFELIEQRLLGAPEQDSDTLFVALLRKPTAE